MKKNNISKFIAPIIITVIQSIVFFMFIYLAVFEELCFEVIIIGFLITGGIEAVSIYVLVERIKEIRSGEEDDLSKY